MEIKETLCHIRPISSCAWTPNTLCAVLVVCVSLKEAFLFKQQKIQVSVPPPLSSLQHCLSSPPPFFFSPLPLIRGSQCVAMETATWVCCSCLSFRCKRCTTHLTISWWMEGWWLRGTVRCLVARRTTFSLCRYSTACAWLHRLYHTLLGSVRHTACAWPCIKELHGPFLAKSLYGSFVP